MRVGTEAEAESATQQARARVLVIVSSSASAYHLNTRLRDLAVPVIVLESLLYDDMGMTGLREDQQAGMNWSTGEIDIKDPTHPLAAGHPAGAVRVFTDRSTAGWGIPGVLAGWVATMGGDPSRATVFAYERGTQMPGLAAPARRVGFFLRGTGPLHLTDEGWALFDAAVRWSLGGAR